MKAKEKNKLAEKFGIKSYGGGSYGEGLFDGLDIADKYYRKSMKEAKK